MAKKIERQAHPSDGSWLTTFGDRAGVTWELIKKVCFFGIGLFVVGVIVHDVVRECRFDGIVIESVIVKGSGVDGAPSTEMATQQIATYIDIIQRTGAQEWRPHALDEGQPPAVTIQIPGSSLNIESVVHEIASLFPNRRKALKISITPNAQRSGYTAAIAVTENKTTKREACETDNIPTTASSLGKMFECLALQAMKSIDPLFAASYLLSQEKAECDSFRPEPVPEANAVAKELRLIEVLRDYCSFKQTRTAVSTIIDRGKADDQPWVSYIYGRLHLARAEAMSKVDPEAQWYEYDRAINRFREFPQNEVPASALAIQMEAYIKNGLSIHESVRNIAWSGESAPIIRYQLDRAQKILKAAAEILDRLAGTRQKAVTSSGTAQAAAVDENRIDSMINHLRGLIVYRLWMIETHRRHEKKAFGFAEGDKEREQVSKAVEFFETSYRQGRRTEWLFLDWGNALRALGEFDAAVAQYRRAGEVAPNYYAPMLNVAIALLEKSEYGGTATMEDHSKAVRHTSSYLAWVGEGGPYDNLVDRLRGALAKVGDGSEARAFDTCFENLKQFEADRKHLQCLRGL